MADFVEALRIRRTVGDSETAYQYERDVEQFFRHSPAVIRDGRLKRARSCRGERRRRQFPFEDQCQGSLGRL